MPPAKWRSDVSAGADESGSAESCCDRLVAGGTLGGEAEPFRARGTTMRPAGLLATSLGLLSPLVICDTTAGETAETPTTLRERVLKASAPDPKARAYREWFRKVGRAGLA